MAPRTRRSDAAGPASALDHTGLTETPDVHVPTASDVQRVSVALQDSSAFGLVFGREHSWRRYFSAFVVAFWSATVVRQLCFSRYIFGHHLATQLAPIERDDVEWAQIALVRLIDLIILQSAWHYSGRTVDGPFLGGLLTAISRPPMYSFVYSHFLVGARALSEVFVTDVFAALVAGGVVAYISPRRTAFRRPPMSFLRRLDGSAILAIGLSIAVGTMLSSVALFLADRFVLHEAIKRQLKEHSVPAYHASHRPSFAFAVRHPLLPIPVLRSDLVHVTMADALTFSFPLALTIAALALFVLPQSPSRRLAYFAAALTGPAIGVHLHNIFPLKPAGAALIAGEVALRSALVAAVVGWILVDVRKPAAELMVVKPVALIADADLQRDAKVE